MSEPSQLWKVVATLPYKNQCEPTRTEWERLHHVRYLQSRDAADLYVADVKRRGGDVISCKRFVEMGDDE